MMNLISRLKKQKRQLQMLIEIEGDFISIYESLELLRIYFELLDGEDNPSPITVPGTTPDLFGKKFKPLPDEQLLERVATEIRTNLSLYLYPQLVKRSENEYELPHSHLRSAIESLRVQIERWLVLSDEFASQTNQQQDATVPAVSFHKREYSSIA